MISLQNISKSFSGVKVLHNISFEIPAGNITALMGENGAGKSTLMKILSGLITDYEGSFSIRKEQVKFRNVNEAEHAGIVMIHQELNLIHNLSVAENIFLGKEPVNAAGFIRYKEIYSKAETLLKEFQFPFSAKTLVGNISLGWQQMVEIIKALKNNSEVLIMDEPTSSLTEHEKEILFQKMRYLKKMGKSILYISHRMSEVFEIADEIVIMRDGRFVRRNHINEISRGEVIEAMVGKSLTNESFTNLSSEQAVLKVENVCVLQKKHPLLYDLNFTANKGDVIGIAGLLGAGRSSLLKFLYGALDHSSFTGTVTYENKLFVPSSVRSALSKRICFLTEDRKHDGIFAELGIKINTTASTLEKLSNGGFIDRQRERESSSAMLTRLNTKYQSLQHLIKRLSGGNQQKVLLSRLLLLQPNLILLDEPTRGIDVGAKDEIYRLIHTLSSEGITFLISSSEIPELTRLCNKILVMSSGYQTLFSSTSSINNTDILNAAFARV